MIWVNGHFYLQLFILIYFLCINSIYTFLSIVAFFEVNKKHKRSFIDDYPYLKKSKLVQGCSLLVAAYNEEVTIVESVKSFLVTDYPKLEIIIVNDGSTDKTLEILKTKFKLIKYSRTMQTTIKTKKVKACYISLLDPRLIVIDKVNGKKADATNAGINAASYPYIVSMDADVIMEKDSMLRVMKPMLENPEKNIVSGGIVRVVNNCVVEDGKIKDVRLSKNPLPIFQVIEYMRAFNAGRTGFAALNSLLIVSGAFHIINTNVARLAGGYESKTVTEDMEMLVRVHKNNIREKKDYKILYLPFPVCWTEVPEDLKTLGKQRNRWHRGLCDVLSRHKVMIANPRYGRIGLFGMAYFFMFELLGPFIEFMGYFYIGYIFFRGTINWSFLVFL
ncbi:glycosyltransferase family 2 protein [Candidatus Margulisiibacteriota bacterium]